MGFIWVEARWFRRENLWWSVVSVAKRRRTESLGNAQGAIEEKTGKESMICSR